MQAPTPSCVRHQSKTGHRALLTPAQARMLTAQPCSLCLLAQAVSEALQVPAAAFPQAAVPLPALTSDCLQKGTSLKGAASVLQLSTCCSLSTCCNFCLRASSTEFLAKYRAHSSLPGFYKTLQASVLPKAGTNHHPDFICSAAT